MRGLFEQVNSLRQLTLNLGRQTAKLFVFHLQKKSRAREPLAVFLNTLSMLSCLASFLLQRRRANADLLQFILYQRASKLKLAQSPRLCDNFPEQSRYDPFLGQFVG